MGRSSRRLLRAPAPALAPFVTALWYCEGPRADGLESLWGPAGRTLRERLLDAPDPPSVLRRLELELWRRAGDRPAREGGPTETSQISSIAPSPSSAGTSAFEWSAPP